MLHRGKSYDNNSVPMFIVVPKQETKIVHRVQRQYLIDNKEWIRNFNTRHVKMFGLTAKS